MNTALVNTALQRVKVKALMQGLIALTVFYIFLFAFITIKGGSTVKELEDKFASKTVHIDRENGDTILTQNAEKPGSKPPDLPDTPSPKGKALQPSPIEGLFKKAENGILPVIAQNGLTPFKAYKRPFPPLKGGAVIALAVLDYGLSAQESNYALQALPPEVSLILSPYSPDAENWQKKAREDGHEIWLNLPIENETFPVSDLGPQAILSFSGLKYNLDKLEWALSRTSGYAGVAASSDNVFEENRPLLNSLFKNIFSYGVGYLELNPEASDTIEALAVFSKTPYAKSIVDVNTVSLKKIESMARENGYVIGVVKPFPNSIKALKLWTDTLKVKGFTLAPISAAAEMAHKLKKPLPAKEVFKAPAVPPQQDSHEDEH